MRDYIHIRSLLVKARFDELTPSEAAELAHVLQEDEEARAIEREVNAIPIEVARRTMQQVDVGRGWERVLEKEQELLEERGKRRRLWAGGAVAASVLIGLAIYIGYPARNNSSLADGRSYAEQDRPTLQLASGQLLVLNDTGQQQINANGGVISNNNRVLDLGNTTAKEATGWNTIRVPKKLDFKINLPDGSVVWLNSSSALRFPLQFSGATREVFIDEGEAYFQVAQQSNKPFVVHTPAGPVNVLGTEFNVNTYRAGTVITSLVSGKVSVATPEGNTILSPDQEMVLSGTNKLVRSFDASTTVSWREGIHYFRKASVSEISTMLSRWFDVEMVVDNPQVANIRFSGSLNRNFPVNQFVDEMNLTKEAVFYWKDGVLHCK